MTNINSVIDNLNGIINDNEIVSTLDNFIFADANGEHKTNGCVLRIVNTETGNIKRQIAFDSDGNTYRFCYESANTEDICGLPYPVFERSDCLKGFAPREQIELVRAIDIISGR